MQSGRRSFTSRISVGAACRWVWNGGGAACCEICWIFSNILRNAAVNRGFISLGYGSGLPSDSVGRSRRCVWDAGAARGPSLPSWCLLSQTHLGGVPHCERSLAANTRSCQHPHLAVPLTAAGDPKPSSFPHTANTVTCQGFL